MFFFLLNIKTTFQSFQFTFVITVSIQYKIEKNKKKSKLPIKKNKLETDLYPMTKITLVTY